jgi:hypothetical protein
MGENIFYRPKRLYLMSFMFREYLDMVTEL